MYKKFKKYGPFILVLAVILVVAIVLFYYSPSEIVADIGVKNSYLVLFLLALFGGASTFTSSSFYASIGIFAAGGLDPAIIALSAAPGLIIGDLLYYFLGREANVAFLEKYHKPIQRVSSWFEHRKQLTPIFIFIYTGFTPFPGDLLMFFLALIEYPFKKILAPLIIGQFTLIFLIALLAQSGLRGVV